MTMAHTAILFNHLKPICGSIIENPTIEQLCKLKEFISTHDENIIQSAFEYTVFPLYIHLEKENSYKNNLKQEIIDTLKCLLEVVTIEKIQFIIRLCTVLTKQIVDGRTSTIIQSTDEELKLSVINCLIVLFSRLSPTIVCELYTRKDIMHFSQTFYLCVQILNLEKMRDLKLAAIKCLMTMCYVHDEADDTDIVLRKQVADATMFFLPGVSIALRNTAIADEKQGRKITFMAIRALTRIIVIQMTEYEPPDDADIVIEFPPKENKPKPVEVQPVNVEAMKQILECETKTVDWFRKTSDNLKIIIGSLVPLTWHSHELVRYELSDLCDKIFRTCSKSLECCLSFCIEILISLSEDEHLFVAEKCKVALVDLLAHEDISLFDILCENFYAVITRLPRILITAGKEEQLSALSLLVGYIKILGQNHLCKILQSPDQLGRLMEFFVFASQMEDTHATLFEDHSIRDFESITTTTPQNWKQFKLIHEEKHFTKMQTALHFLAKSNALDILIDSLCDMFMNEFEQRNAVVFLLNEILSVTLDNEQNHVLIVSDVMKMYMNETDWYLPTDVDYLTLSEIHFNIIQMCLLVEGLGNMAMGIGVHYKQFLFKTLYIILERAGSGQPLLSAAGLAAIVKISKACNYNSVTDLIVQNTDYFSFHVVKRLKKLDQDINVLNVLNVVMKHSKIDVLPSIMEIIDGVLLHSFDKFQARNLTSFLEVFYSFITNLKRWLNINLLNDNRYIELLKEYKKNMDFFYAMYGNCDDYKDEMMGKSAEELFEEDVQRKQEIEDEYHEEEDDKKVPPDNIKLIVKVLKRSLHFLPSKKLERKLLVLNILIEGLVLISAWENELLPLVHQIWSPLVDRLQSTEEALEINKSFELLLVLAKLSKDFIRHRTSKEVFPEICKTLKNTSEQSYLKDRGAAYRYTQNYKLQLIILNNFAQLITNLEMSFEDVHLAVIAVTPYLSDRQPIPLQESAIQFFKTLACFDFETVWSSLIELWGPESKPITNSCRKNTEILLKSLEVIHW